MPDASSATSPPAMRIASAGSMATTNAATGRRNECHGHDQPKTWRISRNRKTACTTNPRHIASAAPVAPIVGIQSQLAAACTATVIAAFTILRSRVSGPVFGRDGLRVVVGVLAFYCVFAGGVGLAGRYDLTVGALAVALLLWRIRQRAGGTGPAQAGG